VRAIFLQSTLMAKKIIILVLSLTPLFARNTFLGQRGTFKTYSARPEQQGILSLNLFHLEWNTQTPSSARTDHYHFFRYHGGIGFAPLDFFEFSLFGDFTSAYVDRVDIPVDRENVGFLDCDNYGLSLKFGYPFYLARDSTKFWAAGLQTFVSLTSNKTWNIHEQVNQYIYYFTTGKIGFVPRAPELGFRGLFDYDLKLLAFHLNLGLQSAGRLYIEQMPYAQGQVHRNPQLLFGASAEFVPTPYVIFISELVGNFEIGQNSSNYLWFTPGVRFCTTPKYGVNFDFGCEIGLTEETPAWNFVFGLSVTIDVIP